MMTAIFFHFFFQPAVSEPEDHAEQRFRLRFHTLTSVNQRSNSARSRAEKKLDTVEPGYFELSGETKNSVK